MIYYLYLKCNTLTLKKNIDELNTILKLLVNELIQTMDLKAMYITSLFDSTLHKFLGTNLEIDL